MEDISNGEHSTDDDHDTDVHHEAVEEDTASNRSTPAKSLPCPLTLPNITGSSGAITGRGVTLGMLMQDGVIKPGNGLLNINYLGRKFIADLMDDGRIRWQETQEIFSSPSAWAIHCKKIVNPAKKSGCGWASVKYKGHKLDVYKSAWFRKHSVDFPNRRMSMSGRSDSHTDDGRRSENDFDDIIDDVIKANGDMIKYDNPAGALPARRDDHACNSTDGVLDLSMSGPNRNLDKSRKMITFAELGRRNVQRDPNTLVQCASFSQLGRRQPFTITVASNCIMMVDFHAHLTTSEIVGYLAGKWDQSSQHLIVQQAFPCRARLGDKENSLIVEEEVRQNMERRGLSLVGWYHSHTQSEPQPTVRDIEAQFEYQLCLKGFTNSYQPCIGLIITPYPKSTVCVDSKLQAFCIVPPMEVATYDYCVPVEMKYTEIQDTYLLPDVVNEMRLVVDFYRAAPDLVKFNKNWALSCSTYIDKIKACLAKRTPKDQIESGFLHTIQILINQCLCA